MPIAIIAAHAATSRHRRQMCRSTTISQAAIAEGGEADERVSTDAEPERERGGDEPAAGMR